MIIRKAIIALGLFTNSLLAQDSTFTAAPPIMARTKEYHLTLTDFSPFVVGVKYKRQVGRSTFFKLGLVNLSFTSSNQKQNNSNSFPVATVNYSAGMLLGVEFRRQVTSKFTFYHGPNISYSYQRSVSKNLNPAIPQWQQKGVSESHSVSIPYSLGGMVSITSHFLISAELNPSVNFITSYFNNGSNVSGLNTQVYSFSLGSQIGVISLVYRL